jgi:hypothetical protein
LPDGLLSRHSVTRLAAEGFVVVASILIAFALDAWWAERQLEQEIAEDLAIVEYEMAENIRLAQLTIDIMEQVVAASNIIIATLEAQPDSAIVEVPDNTFFWGFFSNPTFDPSLGGTDAWIAAGRLAGIDSPELRQRLASVRGKVADVREEQLVGRDISVFDIYPVIDEEIGDIELIQQMFASGMHARQGTSIQAIPESGKISVRNSNALRFLLRARIIWYESSIYEMGDFQAELEEIQVLIQEEIG